MRYYTYETITLKLFIEIVNTGEFEKVARSKVYDVEKCYMEWEQILLSNSRHEGTNKIGITFDSFKAYIRYSAVFVMVNSLLTKLQFNVSYEDIDTLAKYGYNISKKKSEYMKSIQAAFNKLRNVSSKIQSKQLEIEALMNKKHDGEVLGLNLGVLLAEASSILKFQLNQDILLCEYNQYVKLIKTGKV